MELDDLILRLQEELEVAFVLADDGNKRDAREHLREAKKLLDDEFAKD